MLSDCLRHVFQKPSISNGSHHPGAAGTRDNPIGGFIGDHALDPDFKASEIQSVSCKYGICSWHMVLWRTVSTSDQLQGTARVSVQVHAPLLHDYHMYLFTRGLAELVN
jgi:hypothetical protein